MIYVHIPFCKSFCTYCAFYSEICSDKVQKLFMSSLEAEIEARRDEINAVAGGTRTLYFGGGTPSVLPVSSIRALADRLDAGPYEEFTVEVNPDDVDDSYAAGLAAAGVTRVSMGVQSFDDGILKWMNRRHTAEGALKAFDSLVRAGIKDISIDLIFGISLLSDDMWTATLDKALALRPQHISAYQLSVETDSALDGMVRSGRYREADDSVCRRQYDLLCERLQAAGYHHYEISNFALPGHEAVHNSAYWKRVPYIGLGPGAHSFDGSVRSWNSCELRDWKREGETLSEEEALEETVMLSLRTDRGVEASLLDRDKAVRMLERGLLVWQDGRLRIPEEHFFVSDDIVRELI